MPEVILKRFEQPDEVRTFEKGKFEMVRLGGMTIGRATYEPGWKWSTDVGSATGAASCGVEHVGMVISGRAIAAMDDGRVIQNEIWGRFLYSPRARQLGPRRGAVRFAAFSGCGDLRGHEEVERPIIMPARH